MKIYEHEPYEIFWNRLCANIMANTFTFYDMDYYDDLKHFKAVKLNKENHLEILVMWS